MFKAIGRVQNDVHAQADRDWGDVVSRIVVDGALADGLAGLEDFGHLLVVYHLDRAAFEPGRHLVRRPQGREDMPMVGIFAQRAKNRPNPIGVTAVRLVAMEAGRLVVQGLDAVDGTPVLDIKPYYPQYDRRDATVPRWVDRLMEGYF